MGDKCYEAKLENMSVKLFLNVISYSKQANTKFSLINKK